MTSSQSHRDLKKEETRSAILTAARELFEENGVEATTMDDIAQRAWVSRPTVFNYFARKEDLLKEIIGGMIRLRVAVAVGRTDLVIPERMRGILAAVASVFEEVPRTSQAFHVLMMQVGARGNLSFADQDLPMGIVEGALAELVREGQATGDLRQDFDLEAMVYLCTIGLFSFVMRHRMGVQGANRKSLTELVGSHFDLIVGGIRHP